MPEIAKKVTLDLKQRKLFVDGTEFPWAITADGPTFGSLVGHHVLRTVTLSFFTDDVEVIPEGDG